MDSKGSSRTTEQRLRQKRTLVRWKSLQLPGGDGVDTERQCIKQRVEAGCWVEERAPKAPRPGCIVLYSTPWAHSLPGFGFTHAQIWWCRGKEGHILSSSANWLFPACWSPCRLFSSGTGWTGFWAKYGIFCRTFTFSAESSHIHISGSSKQVLTFHPSFSTPPYPPQHLIVLELLRGQEAPSPKSHYNVNSGFSRFPCPDVLRKQIHTLKWKMSVELRNFMCRNIQLWGLHFSSPSWHLGPS